MLGRLRRYFDRRRRIARKDGNEIPKQEYVSESLQKNIQYIKDITRNISDVVYREIKTLPQPAVLVYLDTISDKDQIGKYVIEPLTKAAQKEGLLANEIVENILEIPQYEKYRDMDSLLGGLMSGNSILLIDGFNIGYGFNTTMVPTRPVSEPTAQTVVRGPRSAFVENVRLNMGLLRAYCKDPNLKFEHMVVGRRTKTDIFVTYIAGVTSEYYIKEAKNRIGKIDVDKITDSGDLEEYLSDNLFSPFPQIISAERPDRAIAGLTQGRVAILIENSPFVLLAPASLHSMLGSPEDYYEHWIPSSAIRIGRYLAFLISMVLPAVYVALISFNVGLLPRDLITSVASERQGIPFPAFIEVLLMEIGLEFLHEASVRLPRTVGQTVGVVGGLILGEAAVNAGMVSSAMVIIIALTAIASYMIPNYSLALATRAVRIPFIIISSIFGLYGLIMGLIFLFVHLTALTSFGEDYLAPWGEVKPLTTIRDTIFRWPLRSFSKRPEHLGPEDTTMQDNLEDWW